jgi:hypothetical protein
MLILLTNPYNFVPIHHDCVTNICDWLFATLATYVSAICALNHLLYQYRNKDVIYLYGKVTAFL